MSARPGPPPPGLAGPLALIAVISAGAGLLGAAWMAAQAAHAGNPVPAFGAPMLRALLDAGLPGLIGAAGSPVTFWVVFVLLLTATAGVLAAAGLGGSRVLGYSAGRPGGRDGLPARARRPDRAGCREAGPAAAARARERSAGQRWARSE